MDQRSQQLERMELPGCDPERVLRTYAQFRRINAWLSRYQTTLRRWVLADMQSDPDRTWHFADLGAGGLDIVTWFARAATRRGLRVRITAVESDPLILGHLRQHPQARESIEVVEEDVFVWLRRGQRPDYIFCNHFLHHLPEPAILEFLGHIAQAAQRRFIISDLLRSRWSYLGFSLFGSLFLPRSYARPDGLISIQRSFRPEELRALLDRAGLQTRAQVHQLVPGRLIVLGQGCAPTTA